MKVIKIVIFCVAASALIISGCKDKGKSGDVVEQHPKIDTQSKMDIKQGSIKKADGGYTVEECFSMKDQIKDKTIAVRGKVVKFNGDIMSRNWLHIQDGTGKEGTNDLTVTSMEKAEVGQTVLVKGKMAADKTFGPGYVYKVIMEGATIAAEK